MALAARRSIKIHILGSVIALRGLAYGMTFAASIGFAVVALHGERVLDMAERLASWAIGARLTDRPSIRHKTRKEPSSPEAKPDEEIKKKPCWAPRLLIWVAFTAPHRCPDPGAPLPLLFRRSLAPPPSPPT